MGRNIAHHFRRSLLTSDAKAGIDLLGRQFTGGGRSTLVQQAQAVTHTAVGHTGQYLGGGFIQLDTLLICHKLQPGGNIFLADAAEGKPLTTGQNSSRHLVKLGGSQDEQQMLRRLFNDLQQGIKRGNGQHVHLVDDVHTHFHLGRGIHRIVTQVADIVNAVVGSRIDLQHIHAGAAVDGTAGRTAITGISILQIFTVDSLCQNFGAGSLAGTARAGKQVRMAQMAGL